MLCDGRGTLSSAAVFNGEQNGSCDAEIVESFVFVEIGVFGRDHGIFHVFWNVVEWNDGSSFVVEFEEGEPVSVGDEGHLPRLIVVV